MTSNNRGSKGSARSRRWFMQTAAAGSGAALLSTLPFKNALGMLSTPSQVRLANTMTKSAAELELDHLAASHPELHRIATDVLAHAKYTFTTAASGQGGGSGNELADASRLFIATRKPKAQASYMKGTNLLLTAPKATLQAHFGRYAAIAPTTFVTLDRAALLTRAGGPVLGRGTLRTENIRTLQTLDLEGNPKDTRTLEEILKDRENEEKAQTVAADKKAGLAFTRLEFFISKVRCKESTNDQMGDDEIHMGGVAIGATGNHEKVNQWSVNEDMDATSGKNVRNYSGGKHFATYQIDTEIRKPDAFPHVYSAVVALAEIDCGGFTDFLKSVWKHVGFLIADAL